MLGLPKSTEIRRQIPKDAFFSSKGIKGRERERFDRQIHSITVRNIISSETVNLEASSDVPSIYVMELQLNTEDCDDGNLLLLDLLGHKTVYVLTYGNKAELAVVEESVFRTGWETLSDMVLRMDGLDLGAVWTNMVRNIGELPGEVPLQDAVAENLRIKAIDAQIEALEKQFKKERQNHVRRDLHSRIQELKKEKERMPISNHKTEGSKLEKGVTVMHRVKTVKQPRGGYISPRMMEKTLLDDGNQLGPEIIDAWIVGLAVDYLTRCTMGEDVSQAFSVSFMGGMRAGRGAEVTEYINSIIGLDNESVQNACRACMFDSYYRAGIAPNPNPANLIVDSSTCENIRIMVERSRKFFDRYGPVTVIGPKFPGGYTETVAAGDGDYLTRDTLWDLKVSKNSPTKENTLQLAIYYIMGKHSTDARFRDVRRTGIFNPRQNTVYELDMSDIPETLSTIESEVIGYKDSDCIDWQHRQL